MAQVVSTQQIVCPTCNATGVVRVWTCGCQDVIHKKHEITCPEEMKLFDFFYDVKIECGEKGPPRTHVVI
jgi:hypothetical protein